jgi:SAM-dependent methyltransferase
MRNFLYKTRRLIKLLGSSSVQDKLYLHIRIQQVPGVGRLVTWYIRGKARLLQRSPDDYARMQKKAYETYASIGVVKPGDLRDDAVVGSWQQHDLWPDYESFLMRYVPQAATWVALDYGCGPGRNIRRWTDRFRRIDGVDISQCNLDNAQIFIRDKVAREKWPNFFLTEGMNCGKAPPNAYDFAFSTICIQHICVHSIRFSILKSLFECLKPGGRISIQMGYGVPSPNTVSYYENFIQATTTNRGCDVAVSSPDEVKKDLEQIGFVQFEHWLRPVGPGDIHPQWIFFTAVKPGNG